MTDGFAFGSVEVAGGEGGFNFTLFGPGDGEAAGTVDLEVERAVLFSNEDGAREVVKVGGVAGGGFEGGVEL